MAGILDVVRKVNIEQHLCLCACLVIMFCFLEVSPELRKKHKQRAIMTFTSHQPKRSYFSMLFYDLKKIETKAHSFNTSMAILSTESPGPNCLLAIGSNKIARCKIVGLIKKLFRYAFSHVTV